MDQSRHTTPDIAKHRLKRRPRRIVILLGAKLIGVDTVLPVTMALKDEDPSIDVLYLFLDAGSWPTVERNYVLRRGMEKTGRIAQLSTGRRGPLRKLLAGIRLGGWCLAMLATRTWLFCYSDAARFPVRPLATAARLGGGGVLLYAKAAHPGSPALTKAHRSKEARQGVDVRFNNSGDLFLLYHHDQMEDYEDFAKGPFAVIGSPRSYPAWHAHLEAVTTETGICDGRGEPIDLSGQPVLAFFYSGDVKIPTQTDRPREALARILRAISDETPRAVVLIKPHPNCDLDQLAADLAPFTGIDLHITHAHPQILARAATAAIFNNGSYAMNDVYAEGTPIIETSAYQPDILAIGGSLFSNSGRIDASTDEGLGRALRLAAEEPEALPAPDPTPLVWPKPESLFRTLCRT